MLSRRRRRLPRKQTPRRGLWEAADERQGAGARPGERGNERSWISPPGLISCLSLDCFSTRLLFKILMVAPFRTARLSAAQSALRHLTMESRERAFTDDTV